MPYISKFTKIIFKVITLTGKKLVRVCSLAQSIEEEWQVVMIVELLHLDFPRDAIALCVVLEGDWEIATLVELAELGGPT